MVHISRTYKSKADAEAVQTAVIRHIFNFRSMSNSSPECALIHSFTLPGSSPVE